MAYKIPDKEWWFTSKRAARHPRVYPPAKDGKNSEVTSDNNE